MKKLLVFALTLLLALSAMVGPALATLSTAAESDAPSVILEL